MLSGTPIFEGIDDLRGELNFLRLEPYAAKLEDGELFINLERFYFRPRACDSSKHKTYSGHLSVQVSLTLAS